MVEEYNGFIATYKNAVADDLCERIISAFEEHEHIGSSRPQALVRKDTSIFYESYKPDLAGEINQVIWACLEKYLERFPALEHATLTNSACKVQKTSAGGGFHTWHYEKSPGAVYSSYRVIVWTVYLNNIEDGQGETEFLQQHIRLKPEKGMLCFFPADWTHIHRGNTMLNGDKYIATGWLRIVD